MGKEPNIPTESVGTYQEADNGQVNPNSQVGSEQAIITANEIVEIAVEQLEGTYEPPSAMGIVDR